MIYYFFQRANEPSFLSKHERINSIWFICALIKRIVRLCTHIKNSSFAHLNSIMVHVCTNKNNSSKLIWNYLWSSCALTHTFVNHFVAFTKHFSFHYRIQFPIAANCNCIRFGLCINLNRTHATTDRLRHSLSRFRS